MAACVRWAQRLAAAPVLLAATRHRPTAPVALLRRPAQAVITTPPGPATAASRRLLHGTAVVRTDANAAATAAAQTPARPRKWRWWVAGGLTAALAATAAVQYKVITEYERGLLKENPALEHPANSLSVRRLPVRRCERTSALRERN